MRADMFKVIVERPRWGSRWIESPKLKRSDHDLKCIGLKRHARTRAPHKWLNENLRPLERFLRSRRGQHWDTVFSEICEHLDTGSTVKMHVRQHLGDLVMFNIARGRFGELIHDGFVIRLDGPRRRWSWHKFFVDPDDGVLKDIAVLQARIGGAP